MRVPELAARLQAEALSPYSYAIGGVLYPWPHYCLERTWYGWDASYAENGKRKSVHRFRNEDKACAYFQELVVSDKGLRERGDPSRRDGPPSPRYHSLFNEGVQGIRVRNNEYGWCNVPDPKDEADGFRGVYLPAGIVGTLTGGVTGFLDRYSDDKIVPVFDDPSAEEKYRLLLFDSERIKKFLSPAFASARAKVQRSEQYWDAHKELEGEEQAALYINLSVAWDEIFDKEPATIHCGAYVYHLTQADLSNP